MPGGSGCKESASNAEGLGSIPGSGRSPGEGNGYQYWSSTLDWKIPWTEEPGGQQSMGLLKAGCDWATNNFFQGNAKVWLHSWTWKKGVCLPNGSSVHRLQPSSRLPWTKGKAVCNRAEPEGRDRLRPAGWKQHTHSWNLLSLWGWSGWWW